MMNKPGIDKTTPRTTGIIEIKKKEIKTQI